VIQLKLFRTSGNYISWGEYAKKTEQINHYRFMTATAKKSAENSWKKTGGVIHG